MKDYCSLLEKSGESVLDLVKSGTITTKEQEHKRIDKVFEITKKLMDARPKPIVEAIGEMSAKTVYNVGKVFIRKSGKLSKHGRQYLALNLSQPRDNIPMYIRCIGLYNHGLDKVIPDKEFNIGSEYCKNCPFYEEKD